ncbi:phosphotransferase family protein [Streptomyces sp. NBC_01601]|uniref:phosphotransferase family protein n=1 Tax=Streptomyces sp. NBC_01601 TaxID=2975892 RepID=UPI002E28490C|nr:phosphotransferase [Streptomyces sp. NBC_01601]
MSPETVSIARQNAAEASGDDKVVEGPLHGYHHETYVFPLADEAGRLHPGRWKCREPRDGLLWFDRRCFASEERLLTALGDRVPRVPGLVEVGGLRLMRFIEGTTLGARHPSGTEVPEALCRQITELFGKLAAIGPEAVTAERRCAAEDRPADGDSDGFLERLVHFTEHRVYRPNLDRFESLFAELGLTETSFKHLRAHVHGLARRPFCLLHADLHRENFIVDPVDRLWTIDWELAMVGDPLYDLATHLHLMRYPVPQARETAARWHTAVRAVRPGSVRGWADDLPPLLAYKRAQSVFTDVIRSALALESADPPPVLPLAVKLREILAAGARPLGLADVPAPRRVASALTRWHRVHGTGRDVR